MSQEKLKWMKDTLICVVESELCNLSDVDTCELGEVIDMIKDLEEAIYYNTVTEAMNNPGHEIEWGNKKSDHHRKEHDDSRMYYSGGRYPMMYDEDPEGSHMMRRTMTHHDASEDSMVPRDHREGRSHMSRKMYMEAKEMQRDKSIQLRELEKYIQELSQDVTEMIADSSPEEKQYLEKKITALASKIGSMK